MAEGKVIINNMAEAKDDSKKFTELKELLEIIKHKIDMMDVRQTNQGATISLMKDQLSVVNSKLDDPDTGLKRINERLDANTAAVIELEKTVKGYADSYKANDDNIRKVEKRLETLEEDAGVNVPQELQLAPQADL